MKEKSNIAQKYGQDFYHVSPQERKTMPGNRGENPQGPENGSVKNRGLLKPENFHRPFPEFFTDAVTENDEQKRKKQRRVSRG